MYKLQAERKAELLKSALKMIGGCWASTSDDRDIFHIKSSDVKVMRDVETGAYVVNIRLGE